MRAESLIFDVDGTLWDSVELVAKGWNRGLREDGTTNLVCTPERLRSLFGKTMDEIELELLPGLEPARRHALMTRMFAWEHRTMEEDPCQILYPRVQETVRVLSRRHRLFIVSNCQKGYIELLLKKSEMGPWFTGHICFGDTGLCKGETLRLLLKRWCISSAVYVGDTQGDLEAARMAGVPFIWAAYGFGAPEGYDAKIETFAQLSELF